MELFGTLIGIGVGSAISAIVGALFVMFAANKILGFSPSYGKSWLISFFHQIVVTGINIFANILFLNETSGGFFKKLAATSYSSNSLLAGITITLGLIITIFLSQAGITYAMINYNNKTYGNALKMMGIIWGLIALIVLILGIPIGILIYLFATSLGP
jgi:hypothetical protein